MMLEEQGMKAPEWEVSRWFNTDRDLALSDLVGKVVVLEAFQMLCPGCVAHGIPLVQSVQRLFPSESVAAVGLHTVFEHHQAMTPVSLAAFLHEYRITFPVGVDMACETGQPRTMRAYQMRGTPSLLLFDKSGSLRTHHFGNVSELRLGAEIASLLGEGRFNGSDAVAAEAERDECGVDGCVVQLERTLHQ